MRKNKSTSSGIISGIALLITLFAVLCLALLSVLSLLSANSQLSLAERTAEASANFYCAELEAAHIIDQVKSGDFSNVERDFSSSAETFNFAKTIDDNQSLQVSFSIDDGEITITKWSIVEERDWEPAEDFNLWLGE